MKTHPTIGQLRTQVQLAIQEGGARALARELDCSPTGLLKFSKNPASRLYGKTYEKLLPWYERRVAGGMTAPQVDDVRAAVRILTRGMMPEEETRLRQEIARMMEQAFSGRQGVQEAVAAALGE